MEKNDSSTNVAPELRHNHHNGSRNVALQRATSTREFTLRTVILGGLIALVFTAANVYLGLKVGLTFATSIPAAVISMAILRNFKDHTIAENNIVQTIASAAGTLSAIIFVLPGLVMIGWLVRFSVLGNDRLVRNWRHFGRHVFNSSTPCPCHPL